MQIQAKEILDYSGTKHVSEEEKERKCPHITTMIRKFNEVSNWVVSTILREDNIRKRARVMEHWVKIAKVHKDTYNSYLATTSLLTLTTLLSRSFIP